MRLRSWMGFKPSTMHLYLLYTLFTLLILSPSGVFSARVTNPSKVPKNAVLLNKINSLTLRSDKQTSHRRVSGVPQLQCSGPAHICKLYKVDVMRCMNSGTDYDENNVQWTCTANLPEEFKLGSTDVSCEGYESSEDPYVLKGSCGVDYRLLLTEKGEEKFGKQKESDDEGALGSIGRFLFFVVFIGVFAFIVLGALGCFGNGNGNGGNRPGWLGGGNGWGGGGGGGGGGGDWPNDPPPPYTPRGGGPRKPSTQTRSSQSRTAAGQGEAWRPGFWTGTAAGAAAGYMAGRNGSNTTREQQRRRGFWDNGPRYQDNDGWGGAGGGGGSWFGGGGGPSSSGSRGSSGSSSSSFSGMRHESSGFGSTNRR